MSLLKNTTAKLTTAIRILFQSSNVSLPISMITAKIIATEVMFTASKKSDITVDLLNTGIKGFNNFTKTKDGKKIPTVAAMAPLIPPICQPINVAEEKTGPGVNCPTAIASMSCCFESKPLLTSASSRNANRTYPLPYRIEPIFKKIQNNLRFETAAYGKQNHGCNALNLSFFSFQHKP